MTTPHPEPVDLLTALQRSIDRARSADPTYPAGQSGWCKNEDHADGDDHLWRPDCVGFVTYAEHTAQMLAKAAEHDRQAGDSGAEARYVAQHRPY